MTAGEPRINDDLAAWDRDSLLHPATHVAQFARGELPGRIITGGEGSTVIDRDGNRLLDGFAALYCVNAGYGRPEIAQAIARQAHQLAYFHSYGGHGNEPAIRLAKAIMDRAPAHMARVFFGLSGSDANETSVKLAWHYWQLKGAPQRRKIISRRRAYHGSGIVSGSMTGLALYHARFGLPLPGFLHTEPAMMTRRPDPAMTEAAFTDWLVARLEALIAAEGAETIAAFVAEPAMGTGGLVPPPEGYWARIQEVLDRHEILLIADEVVTGFGRTGRMFGCDRYAIRADFMNVAKALTSAYAPLSATLVGRRVFEVLLAGADAFGPLGHGWTYSAHPVSCAAGLASLDLVDRLDLPGRAGRLGPRLLDRLREAAAGHPNVAEVRGVGLMAAVELMADPARLALFDPPFEVAPKIAAAMLRRGVIARAMPEGDIIGFAPPLVITGAEIDRLAGAFGEALAEVVPA